MANLKELKDKRDKLLKKAGMKDANRDTLKRRYLEEKKIKAEIFALEHPESAKAKAALKSAFRGFGRAAKEKSALVARNAARMGDQMRAEAKEKEISERKERIERLKLANKRKRSVKKAVKKTTKKAVKKVKKRKAPDYGW